MIRSTKVACISLLGLLVGCGGGSGGGTPVSVSQMVTQAAGGTVKVGADGALDIPASSLAGDTTITVSSSAPAGTLPEPGSVKGMVYVVGPDGTRFDPPATLTLPLGGTPPANTEVVISRLDFDDEGGVVEAEWNKLDSTVSGDTVSASVEQAGTYAVRWLAVAPPLTGDCAMPKPPCGGDLAGDWKASAGCFPSEVLDKCDGPSLRSYQVVLMGNANFKADMTYALDLPYSVTGKLVASASCVASAGFASCAAVQAELRTNDEETFPMLWANTTCASAAGGGCDCTTTATDSFAMSETGTYTAVADSFTTTATGQAASEPKSYCVDGNKLWVLLNPESDDPEYLLFTK